MQLNFNIYGFIIGLSIVLGSWLIEEQLKYEKILNKIYYKVGVFSFIFAVLGARLWHVVTDFYLYKNNLATVIEIWNGGLSIFGGVLGGVIGLVLSTFIFEEIKNKSVTSKKETIIKLLDYSIFGLPIGQSIGRLGNYFNQELYGAPTSGFLKIFIDKAHRLPGFEEIGYYHPLFFYEMLATGFFVFVLYYLKKNIPSKLPKIGTGNLFISYVLYYSIVRFFLDFLRLDKSISSLFTLGINQVFLAGLVLFIITYYLFVIKLKKNFTWLLKVLIAIFLLFKIFINSVGLYNTIESAAFNTDEYAWVYDSQIYDLRKQGNVEVFKITKDNLGANWSSLDYRIIDQPQMGKYIYGYLISKDFPDFDYVNKSQWFDISNTYYGEFGNMWGVTGGKELKLLKNDLGNEWVEVVIGMRFYSFYIYILLLVIHSIFVFYLFRSKFFSILAVFLLSLHPQLNYFSQVATIDMFSLLFIYLSFILIYILFYQKNIYKRNKRFLLLVMVAILTAVTVSIKPNGIFLIFIIIVKILYDFFLNGFSYTNFKKVLIDVSLYLISFLLVFIILEPEIILSPQYGLYSLIMTRINQQGMFLNRTNYGLIGYIIFLLKSYLINNTSIIYSLFNASLILSGIFIFLKKLIKDKKHILTLILCGSIFIFNYYYARVGFERYLFPSFILLNIISIYGLSSIFRIIKKHD